MNRGNGSRGGGVAIIRGRGRRGDFSNRQSQRTIIWERSGRGRGRGRGFDRNLNEAVAGFKNVAISEQKDTYSADPKPAADQQEEEEVSEPLSEYRDEKEWRRADYRLMVKNDAPHNGPTGKEIYCNQILQELGCEIRRLEQPRKVEKAPRNEEGPSVVGIMGMASAKQLRYRQCILGQNSQVGQLKGTNVSQMLPHSGRYKTYITMREVTQPHKRFPCEQLLRELIPPASAAIPHYGSRNRQALFDMTKNRVLRDNTDFQCHICRGKLLLPPVKEEVTIGDLYFAKATCIPARFHPFLPPTMRQCPCFSFDICIRRRNSNSIGCLDLAKRGWKAAEEKLPRLYGVGENHPEFEKQVILQMKLKHHKTWAEELEHFCREELAKQFFDPDIHPSSGELSQLTCKAFSTPHVCKRCSCCLCFPIQNEQMLIAEGLNRDEERKKGKRGGRKR